MLPCGYNIRMHNEKEARLTHRTSFFLLWISVSTYYLFYLGLDPIHSGFRHLSYYSVFKMLNSPLVYPHTAQLSDYPHSPSCNFSPRSASYPMYRSSLLPAIIATLFAQLVICLRNDDTDSLSNLYCLPPYPRIFCVLLRYSN